MIFSIEVAQGFCLKLKCTDIPGQIKTRSNSINNQNSSHYMKKLEIKTSFQVFEAVEELGEAGQQLLAAAKSALANAYAPYSNFSVGAAVRLQNGKVITSSNYENAAYPLTVCAEHSALIAAANQYPDSPVVAVAITVKNPSQVIDQPALPCGSCRQVIHETELKNKHEIQVILQGETGMIYVFEKGSDMLPLAFDSHFL